MRRARAAQQGFTLIEVLVALALMALLSLISWRALDMVERSSERLQASGDDTLALVRVLGQIESDIGRHAGNGVLPSGTPWNPSARAGALLPPGIQWHDPVLSLVRSAQGGAWQQVAWGTENGSLRRAAGPAARTLPLPEARAGEVMLEHINVFAVRAWIPGQGWTLPGASNARKSATGLEITIGRRHNGRNEIYRKVVQLP
ncbi:PulJ/GspJ family protein [Bordetella petrii]|uniref:PulJ/GspJ family protein n=1 Tax=Bordetella petrii TaxID=94624 RepID=UPI001A95869B|nr:prepilin-type N-terminal cleavage/methylation domain-containing protein [Bordetella petrii]MBO1114162.1 prepilin-type N-terminal cleavage/methylation domain-containing protein [Bordetella petrii]